MIIFGTPKGSLEKPFEELASRCGLLGEPAIANGSPVDHLIIKMIKLRPQDIPLYVARGNLDLGLTGEDCLAERGLEKDIGLISTLPLSRARQPWVRVALYVRNKSEYRQIGDLSGKLVVTEFPHLAGQYFQTSGVRVSFDKSHGATEAIVANGFADAGVDIVDSGLSLAHFELRVIGTLMVSHSILIASKHALADPAKTHDIELIRDSLGLIN